LELVSISESSSTDMVDAGYISFHPDNLHALLGISDYYIYSVCIIVCT